MDAGLDLLLAHDAVHERAVAGSALVEERVRMDGGEVPARQIVEHDDALAGRDAAPRRTRCRCSRRRP